MAIVRFYEIKLDYYGYHADDLSADTVSDFQKSFIVVQAFYFVNSVLTKSSLLYLFYRIFGVSRTLPPSKSCSGMSVLAGALRRPNFPR